MAVRKEGAFIEIALPNGKYSYGRILAKASFGFYNIYSDEKVTDLDKIKNSRILFINSVYKHAITKNRWKIIGVLDIELNLKSLPMEFIQDEIDPSKFKIYNPNTGEIKPARKAECIGLERAAVWEPEHIEERIIDYFEGKPNKWFESMKIKN